MTDTTQANQDPQDFLDEVIETVPDTFKQLMLEAPPTHLDPTIVALIAAEWDDEPTAIQVLKALDFAIHGGMSSDFATYCLETFLIQRMEIEQLTEEQLIEQATWRT